jgi:hypothetical protein
VGGDPAYAEALHLLGNGVVPQAAAYALLVLWERLHGTTLTGEQLSLGDLATGKKTLM